ncbi:hypothetical protein [Burkholderia stagnalis]
MSNGVPRRLIDELINRWTLGRLKAVFVEGPNDQRLIRLLQREPYCPKGFEELDPIPTEAIEISSGLLQKHGLEGSGSKQRVVAASREVLERGAGDGFRGIVDMDLDRILGNDLRSQVTVYTDYSCMDCYLWTTHVLNRMLIQFRCEGSVTGAGAEQALFDSISLVCRELTIARVINQRFKEWNLDLHTSDKSLSLHNNVLSIDINAYLIQCKPPKSALGSLKELSSSIRGELVQLTVLDTINGHDLIWVLTYCLRELSTLQRRHVDEETVRNSLLAFGISNTEIGESGLFLQLADWQNADTE